MEGVWILAKMLGLLPFSLTWGWGDSSVGKVLTMQV